MDKNVSLFEARNDLYRELLNRTVEQKEIMDNLLAEGKKEEDVLPFFASYFERWNQITDEIEMINSQLSSSIVPDQDAHQMGQLMKEIEENVDYIQGYLETTTNSTESDLRGVRNQQKVLNAYYNLNSKDNVPLYFDEKK